MKIGAFIPVRLGSSRLPAKILSTIGTTSPLKFLIDRLTLIEGIADKKQIVICTTLKDEEGPLLNECEKLGVSHFRGSETDLIDRFYSANKKFNFDCILQVDGDDPLVPPEYAKYLLNEICTNKFDVTTTIDLPFGLNYKSFSKEALNKIYKSYITKDNDTGFGLLFTKNADLKLKEIAPVCASHIDNSIRLTLDYPEDLALISLVLREISFDASIDLSRLLESINLNPNWTKINSFRQRENISRTKDILNIAYTNSLGKKIEIKY